MIPKAHREAVARALFEHEGKIGWVEMPDHFREHWRKKADAAIIASLHARADATPIIDRINAILNADETGGRVSQDTVDALVELVRNGGGAGWLPIESAPKDRKPILVAGGTFEHPDSMGGPTEFKGVSIATWSSTWDQWEGESTSHDDCFSHEPTHWQPLPAPPLVDGGKG